MFTLLRRIRMSMVQTGSVSKYLLYAVGEISLVVIGILIALQVNNWNEERKNQNKERIMLETLLSDLKNNEELIEQGFADYRVKIELSEEIAHLFGREEPEVDPVFLDSLIYWWAEYTALELVNASIISLASSDRLELLQNELLKQEIVRYPTYIELYKEREELARSIVINDIRPNIEKHISLQKWWNIQETFPSDYAELFDDRQISNNYLNRLFQTSDAVIRLEKLKSANNSLIMAINEELDDRFD